MKSSITNVLNYPSKYHKELHLFLIGIYNAFTERDYLENEKEINRVIHYYSTNLYNTNTFTGFKCVAENWLKNKFPLFSESEVKALLAKAKQMQEQGETTDKFFVYCISTVHKWNKPTKHIEPKTEKPKAKLTFEFLRNI